MDDTISQTSRTSPGFLYVLTNSAMPDLVKVGQTERHPRIRAVELSNHSGVPTPFEVGFYVEVLDRVTAEKEIHSALAHLRFGNDREFFKASLETVITTILDRIEGLIPQQSPFINYIHELKEQTENSELPNSNETSSSRGLQHCSECGGKMIEDASKMHHLCVNCGHIE